jgi:hypothetical protein
MAKAKGDHPVYSTVDASPVKSFFVSMLTRDIKLEEAILDLLDNCVDGILRTKGQKSTKTPYDGFWAEIKFDRNTFSISDNCGGIPWDLHDYAFKMGRDENRPDDAPGTVGVYGIGMKRAIFKMGEQCLISTQNESNGYEVEITPDWVHDQRDWKIPVKAAAKSMKDDGTAIVIGNLHPRIAARFGDDAKAFKGELERMVATHYAFIIDKGFSVTINGDPIIPRPTKLVFTKKPKRGSAIQPFIFKTEVDGVRIFLAVGFTRPIPSQNEVSNEQEEKRYSSLDAGWTVLCNDRAVLYCDRTELTGWGEAGVPRYHTQFIAVSGIVEFRSDDASKLPTTTTKRGIDASSTLYLQIKNKMRDGMRMFTDYTNKWKGLADEAKKHMELTEPLTFDEIKAASSALPMRSTTKTIPKGTQYKPDLPMPKRPDPRKNRISFVRDVVEIKCVATYLFDDANADPSVVGERCFDLKLREARK